jgi:SLBB domain
MRAYGLCAVLSRASDRPPRRLRVYSARLALIAGLCLPSDASRAAGPTPAARPAYFAILGEVASPGVYELPAGCTLGQLVRYAGGITRDADGNARVFRGARLAERLFVASSEPAILYSGDLIVIDRRATGQSANKSTRHSQVQIGILNLIERPVVMSVAGDQATLVRIVEFLRQPPQLVEQIQMVDPSRKTVRRSANPERDADFLHSGIVLIFPKSSVRLASLPPLPEPIAPAQSPSVNAAGLRAQSEEPTPRSGTQVPGPSASPDAIGRTDPNLPTPGGTPSQESIERLIHASRTSRSSSRISSSPFRNVARKDWESQRLRDEDRSHARSNVFFFVLAGTAALVMMLTIGSMGSRWINEVRSRDSDRPSTILPAPPTLSPLAGVNRPIRVDANQPQTRLGIDLAVFERVKARHTQGTCSDSAPKAA